MRRCFAAIIGVWRVNSSMSSHLRALGEGERILYVDVKRPI
jgi:hypothetical protein